MIFGKSKPLRVIFMGTPEFSVHALNAIDKSKHEVVAVFTQPPRPKDRGQAVQKSPVHERAEELGIPVHTPEKLKGNSDAIAEIEKYDADIAVVAAYGLLLPLDVLEAPKYGCINIHASLLPRWRGAAPIQYAIWMWDKKTGISIMQMDEGLDTGPVITKSEVFITTKSSTAVLHDVLADLGAYLVVDVLNKTAAKGKQPAVPQDESYATYANLLKKEDGLIDWDLPVFNIERQMRAMNPWPSVWTYTPEGKRLKIVEAYLSDQTTQKPPGELIDSSGHVACGQGTMLRLIRVQPENKSVMDFASALNGKHVKVHQRFRGEL